MSNEPLKRYSPTMQSEVPGGYAIMEEVSGGYYINEDELRIALFGLMNDARSRDELAAYQRVMELIDTPNQ